MFVLKNAVLCVCVCLHVCVFVCACACVIVFVLAGMCVHVHVYLYALILPSFVDSGVLPSWPGKPGQLSDVAD